MVEVVSLIDAAVSVAVVESSDVAADISLTAEERTVVPSIIS